MRKSREELLMNMPIWNEDKHDIVKVQYGDEYLTHWNKEMHDWVSTLTGTLSNIYTVDAYIHSMYGNYYIYDTLIGKTYIKEDLTVLCGDIRVTYRGKKYSIFLNMMYGSNGLSITRIDANGVVVGFRNSEGLRSTATQNRTKELNPEVIEKVINNPMEDYGIGIQKFMNAIRDVYNSDSNNHIMEECFNM